jgi:hypothetical protein
MICGIPANLLGAIIIPRVGVWKAIFFGEISGIILGLGGNMWPIFFMNYYHCWGTIHCGDGTWGTELFWAKWGGVIATHILGTFVGAISGPAGEAMISLQVSQTEQASIQAAFRLVSSLSGMYLLQGRYTPSKSFNLPLPLGPCMTPTFLGVGTRRFTSRITISTQLDRMASHHVRVGRLFPPHDQGRAVLRDLHGGPLPDLPQHAARPPCP